MRTGNGGGEPPKLFMAGGPSPTFSPAENKELEGRLVWGKLYAFASVRWLWLLFLEDCI